MLVIQLIPILIVDESKFSAAGPADVHVLKVRSERNTRFTDLLGNTAMQCVVFFVVTEVSGAGFNIHVQRLCF